MREMIVALVGLVVIGLAGCGHHKSHHGGHHEGQGGHHAKMWEMMDADGDGKVTREEFDGAHDRKFSELDTNGDGEITREEMKAHHESMKSKK